MFGPLAPPSSQQAVRVAPGDAFVVRASVARGDAERTARAEVHEGVLRPPDVHQSEFAPLVLAHVPMWRVDVTASGFHVGLSRDARDRSLLPTGGTSHKDDVVLVLGRRVLPFDPTAKLKIAMSELSPRAGHAFAEGELIQPDVTRDDAEREALERVRRAIAPSSALYSKLDARVRSTVFVHYPLWVLRYRYAGQARGDAAPLECHVAVSARTGKVVSSEHPPAWRSVAEKIKRWFD
jgi:hypothetical protein